MGLEVGIVGLPGAGTPEQAMLATILSRAGVKIHQVPFRSFSNRGLAAALEQGEVAAGVMADPWVTRLVEERAVSVLADLRARSDAAARSADAARSDHARERSASSRCR